MKVDDDITLDQLRKEVANQYKASIDAVNLSSEDGLALQNGDATMSELGVSNGAMLIIKDTLQQNVVEKSYIEDGVVIEAGIRIVACDSKKKFSEDDVGANRDDKSVAHTPDNPIEPHRKSPSPQYSDQRDIYSAQVAPPKAQAQNMVILVFLCNIFVIKL